MATFLSYSFVWQSFIHFNFVCMLIIIVLIPRLVQCFHCSHLQDQQGRNHLHTKGGGDGLQALWIWTIYMNWNVDCVTFWFSLPYTYNTVECVFRSRPGLWQNSCCQHCSSTINSQFAIWLSGRLFSSWQSTPSSQLTSSYLSMYVILQKDGDITIHVHVMYMPG